MAVELHKRIQRWSTLVVPESQRRDFYAAALADNLVPMEVVCDVPGPLNAGATFTEIGPLTVFHMQGTKHRSLRRHREMSKSTARNINLVINLASEWRFFQRNHMLLRKGDAVLADSLLPFEIDHDPYDIINLQISETWLRQWIPDPGMLVGKVIPRDAGWGQALSAFISGLSPEAIFQSSMPGRLLVDQVGGLLAQVAFQMNGCTARPSLACRALRAKVQALVVQRCGEQRLTSAEVAMELGVPDHEIHAALRACGMTFVQLLTDTRVEQARQLLESPLLRRLNMAEIGWRCGFSDPAHFSRIIRQRTGKLPSDLRQQTHDA
jgi:AraC-like DNA-binding protein